MRRALSRDRDCIVFRAVGVVDELVDRAIDALEQDFPSHAGDSDPPRLLPHRSLVPARSLTTVGAHVERFDDDDGPNPGRGAIGEAVLTERLILGPIGSVHLFCWW